MLLYLKPNKEEESTCICVSIYQLIDFPSFH